MELDPIWLIAVLSRWRHHNRALSRDLRRWIFEQYLCDAMCIIMCWRALHSSTAIPYPHVDTWWRVQMNKKIKIRNVVPIHIPVLIRNKEYAGELKHAVAMWNNRPYQDGADFVVSPIYDSVVSGINITQGYWQHDLYLPTPYEYRWLIDYCRVISWKIQITTVRSGLDCCDKQISAIVYTPRLSRMIAEGMIETHVHTSYWNEKYYLDCINWYRHDSYTRGRLFIQEMQNGTIRRRTYVRSGMPIIVSLRELASVNRLDDALVLAYMSGVTFVR